MGPFGGWKAYLDAHGRQNPAKKAVENRQNLVKKAVEDRQNLAKKATPQQDANAGPVGLPGSTVDGQSDGQTSKAAITNRQKHQNTTTEAMRAALAAGKVQTPASYIYLPSTTFES